MSEQKRGTVLMDKKFLSPREVEEIYGIDSGTLANWRTYGKGPSYIKVGRLIKYVIADLEEYFERHRIQTSDQREKSSPTPSRLLSLHLK